MPEPAAKPAAAETEKPKGRPEKPDEEVFKASLVQVEKDHKAAQEKLNAIKAKIDLAKPQDRDSPTAKKQQELRAELSEIRQQQSGFKSSRGNIQDKITALDTQLKSRVTEQKNARGKVAFKNVEEVDREITKLEKQVDAGTMKLVDEKKALSEISSLRKQKKGFAGFEDAQKGIDNIKAQIAELRKTLDNPEAKALSEKYNGIAKQLDEIKAEQDSAFKNLNALRDERTKLHAEQQVKYTAMRELKDKHYQAKTAYRQYENEAYRVRQEKQRGEREAYAKDKRKKAAAERLEEASQPAFLDEIYTAEGLIRYFDPSTPAEERQLRAPSAFKAEPQRQIDSAPIKGTALAKKEDREDTYFMGGSGKKGKKGKKGNTAETPATPTESKFNLSVGVFEELAKVNVEPPSSQSDVPAVIEKLKAKVAHWKADQDKKTKENIAKAQADIDRLETEATEETTNHSRSSGGARDGAKKASLANSGAGGGPLGSGPDAAAELAQEKDAVADAAEDLKAARTEDAAA